MVNLPLKHKRICFISHSSGLYGAEKALLELVVGLKAKDVYSLIILPSDGPLRAELENNKIDFLIAKYWWWTSKEHILWKCFARSVLNVFSAIIIASRIKRYNITLICSNTLTISVGMFIAKILKLPHIYFIHEFGKEDHGLKFDMGEQLSLYLMNKFSTVILCNSYAVAGRFSKYLDKIKLFVIYQAVSVGSFMHNPESQIQINAESKAVPLKCVIVGSLQEGKRQEDAILAISKLKEKGVDVSLEIVGDGDLQYKSFLLSLVNGKNLLGYVHFNGFVNPPFAIIKNSDVLLVCSKHEAFGRVTVEGMLLAKPVIGANSGGTQELIKEGFNGLLYTTGNYIELAEKIEYNIYTTTEKRL